jgi:hypothetical protein
MITRTLWSEFGHEVTIGVEREPPTNDSEFALVHVGVYRDNQVRAEALWFSELEAQTLRHMLMELLCPEAFEALLETDDAPDDGAYPMSRKLIRQLVWVPNAEKLCQGCGGELGKGYVGYCASCYAANGRETVASCDSDSDPQGGDAVAAPGEASQSGGEAASPKA